MSDTPETDAAELIYDGIVASGYVDSEVCRKLERERDEARDTARWLYQHGMATLIEGASGNDWIKEEIK